MRARQLELTQTAATGKRTAKRPRGRAVVIDEASVQSAIVARLSWAGYLVMSTSRVRKGVKCTCGRFFFPTGSDGVTKGCPDLFISHLRWPPGLWIGIEVKGSQTPLSPEQKQLVEAGRYCVARDQDEADRLIREAEFAILGRNYGRKMA